MDDPHPKSHVIVFPLPLQGHVKPAVNLAIKLASMGVTVTFVNTQFVDHQTSKSKLDGNDMFASVRQSGLDVRYTVITDGFPLNHDRMQEEFWRAFEFEFPARVDEFIDELVSSEHEPPINCLIADTFLSWSSKIATKYKLVNISFWTEPAIVYSLYYHMDMLRTNGHVGSNSGNRADIITYIPGVPAIHFKDLPSYIQDDDASDIIFTIIKNAFENAKGADSVLLNTIQELESETISTLQEEQQMYAIGPMFPSDEYGKSIVPSGSFLYESNCVQWLNDKPEGTVLYVSFGSLFPVDKQDIIELAYSFLLSEVNFVWVLPPHVVGYDLTSYLPNGYEDDVKDKGLIVQWCNQLEVLSHPATGFFLSHCGWNSTLESIGCGVPLLCFPLGTDQITNRKLIVDDWKIGINLCQSKSITRQEAARNINHVMSDEAELRENVIQMRKTMQNSIAAGGSTEKNLDRFINDMNTKTNAKM